MGGAPNGQRSSSAQRQRPSADPSQIDEVAEMCLRRWLPKSMERTVYGNLCLAADGIDSPAVQAYFGRIGKLDPKTGKLNGL